MTQATITLCWSVFLAVLGSWQFGYHTGVMNAPLNEIKDFIAQVYKRKNNDALIDFLCSLLVSLFALSGMLGGLFGGKIADRFGRRTALVLNSLVIATGIALMAASKEISSYMTLIFGRLIIGFSCGLYTILVPMFLAEIASVSQRGAIGAISQLGVTIGLLNSQVLGLEAIFGNKNSWPWLFFVALIPALAQILALPFCPESPRFLLDRHRDEESQAALVRLRGYDSSSSSIQSNDVSDEIEEMRAEISANKSEQKVSLMDLIRDKGLRSALIVGIVLQLSQQLSGINSVFYYSTIIFESAGLGHNAKFATVGVGIVMVVTTIVSIPLMNGLGRRTLHLYGLGGMFFAAIALTISLVSRSSLHWMNYISVISALTYVMFFAIGPGSVPWLFISEIFTQGPRGAAMSIAVFVNWSANFTVGISYPFMQSILGDLSFLPFIKLLATFWFYAYKRMPETRNKTFEEIATLFKPKTTTTTDERRNSTAQPPNYGTTATTQA